jgi:hypothetical protein
MTPMANTQWLLATVLAAGLAGCSGQAPGEGNRAPRAVASGIAPAAPHAQGHGRAAAGKTRAPARKPPSPMPEDDPFDPLAPPDAGAQQPGHTEL